MPIQNCPLHGLVENVICCEGECIRRYCHQCFELHNPEHSNGVIFNQIAKESLIEWNKFLMDKFHDIQANVKSKGSNTIFQLRLNANYPKGLLSEISNSEITDVCIKVIYDYLQTLATNIQFISTRQTLEELDIPELFKDLFIFFFYDTGNGLNFLAEKLQEELKLRFPDKKIYEYVEFVIVPKYLRQLQIKRKALTSKLQQTAIVRLKKGNGALSPKPKTDKQSPRKNMLLSNNSRMKSYNENSNPSSLTNLQVLEKQKNSSYPLYSPQGKTQSPQISQVSQKIQQTMGPKRDLNFSNFGETVQLQSQIDEVKQLNPSEHQTAISYNQKGQTQAPLSSQHDGRLLLNIEIGNKYVMNEALENEKLKIIIYRLQQKLKQKQKSISALNKLIGNEEEEIQFRQNEVQILEEEIKKLKNYKEKFEINQKDLEKTKQALSLKQRSIAELNKLIGNQEQQLRYREGEVQVLTNQIKKLVQFKQKYSEIEEKLNQKEKQLDLREKGIKQLNNVISNQQQELAFRENQVQMLTKQLKKSEQSKIQIEKKLEEIAKVHEELKKQVSEHQISSQNNIDAHKNTKDASSEVNTKSFDEQLMEEVIQLETQIVVRNQDIRTLSGVLNSLQKYIPNQSKSQIVETLRRLKTVKIQM